MELLQSAVSAYCSNDCDVGTVLCGTVHQSSIQRKKHHRTRIHEAFGAEKCLAPLYNVPGTCSHLTRPHTANGCGRQLLSKSERIYICFVNGGSLIVKTMGTLRSCLIIDCVLFRHGIPAELRAIVTSYLIQHPLTNQTIRNAVTKWCSPTDRPNIEFVYGHISYWDTSQVTVMNFLFQNNHDFNEDISQWDVSNVTTMRHMFFEATSFNSPLDCWDVSNVRDMTSMFSCAYRFNQPLNKWNPSKVINMTRLFESASRFNQPLNQWNVTNVTHIYATHVSKCRLVQPIVK